LSLSVSDLEKPVADRQLVELSCRYAAAMPGPSRVTLCVAASSSAGDGSRSLRRAGGSERIGYRLFAGAGTNAALSVSRPFQPEATPRPVLTTDLNHGEQEGLEARFEVALTTEVEPLRGRFLTEGEYRDDETDVRLSLHEGQGCDAPLWESGGAALSGRLAAILLPATCQIEALAAIQFGVIADFAVETRKTGALGVRCSPGSSFSIELGPGNHAEGGVRRMVRETAAEGASEFLAYRLETPGGEEWSAAASPVRGSAYIGSGTGQTETIRVDGVIAAGTAPPLPGQYRDSVIATLIY
jgi:spore coat protein U-like protein